MAPVKPILKGLLSFGGSFLAVYAGLTVAADFVPFYIDTVQGGSMKPTFNPDNSKAWDRVLAKRLSSSSNLVLRRGDVVDAVNPRRPEGDKVVKRIIALPGDTVLTPRYHDDVVKILPGHCWLEGDHPETSADSNYYGPVPLDSVCGKVLFVVWPPSRFGRVPERRATGADAKRMSSILYSDR